MGSEGYQLRAELGALTGRTSMPNVFIAGESIGGCNDGTPGLMPLIAEKGAFEAALARTSLPFRVKRAFAKLQR